MSASSKDEGHGGDFMGTQIDTHTRRHADAKARRHDEGGQGGGKRGAAGRGGAGERLEAAVAQIATAAAAAEIAAEE